MSKLLLITGLAVAAVHSAGAGEAAKAPQQKCFQNVGVVQNLIEYDANANTGCDWETKRAILCMQTNGTRSDATDEEAAMYRACLWGDGNKTSSYENAQADCLACKTASGELTKEEADRWAKAQKTAKGVFQQNPDIRKTVWDVVQETENNGAPGENNPEDGAAGNGTPTPAEQPPTPSTSPAGSSGGNDAAPAAAPGSGKVQVSQFKVQALIEKTIQANVIVEALIPIGLGTKALVSSKGTGDSKASSTVEETSQLRVVQTKQMMKTVVHFGQGTGKMRANATFVSEVTRLILTDQKSRAASDEDRQTLPQLKGSKKGISDEDLKQESPVKVKEASPECEESLKAVEEKVLPESQGQLSEQEVQKVTSEVISKTTVKLEKSVSVQITAQGFKTGSIGAGGEESDLEDETEAAGGAGGEMTEAGSATGGGEQTEAGSTTGGGEGQTEGGSSTEGGEQTEAGSATGGGEGQTEGGSSTEGGQPPKKPGSCKRRRRRSSSSINRRRQVSVRTA
ncbi:hypothetical protein VFPFJ_05928 [Purpureocillium lilacinum]|uniref:Uncharacterized protein n=1 Tax=Purpureocillium lilacinum TaxID=33203 RepID=A0A179HGI1_PURLI|nr:hypothetical protein VFPFJ_05928 [Purpureocillium lilacinum]OAQ89516.1 hypothetical protein VFPFJ_05928 [Purpureocillium lilacinum]